MAWKRKIAGGVVAFIGFMLSPLSWWNDLFVNVPLALLFAWVVGLVYRPAAVPHTPEFTAAVVIGYWLTNIIGLVLMQKGAQAILSDKEKKYTRRDLVKDLAISLLYTGVIVLLLQLGVLKPFKEYFAGH